MGLRRLFTVVFAAAFALIGCAPEWSRTAAPPALAADPFFADQPGALTPEELQAARAAMKSARGAAGELPLFASGRRENHPGMTAYAVFAGSPERLGKGVLAYRRMGCNFFKHDQVWRCGTHSFFQIEAGGRWQAFRYTYRDGAEQPAQLVADMVAHVFTPCFENQYRALVGSPRPERAIVIHEAFQAEDALRVMTTQEAGNDQYAVRKAASGNCPFALHQVMLGATGKTYPAKP